MRKTAIILGLLLVSWPLWAADAPAPAPPPPAAKPAAPAAKPAAPAARPAAPAARPAAPGTVSVSMESADLRAVVTALAEANNINLVGSDQLTGSVTVHLTNAPVLEALQVILRNAGFELVTRDNGIYEIMSREEALKAKEGQWAQLKVFTLSSADVTQVAKLLVPNAVPDIKSIAIDPASSRLIISGTEEQFKKAEQIIKAVDIPLPQVAIQARIVEISVDRAESLGVSFSGTFDTDKLSDKGKGVIGIDLTQDPVPASTLDFTFTSHRIDATLKALIQDKVAEVLSAPQVTTSHGRLAEIKVVNQVPIITRTTQVVNLITVTTETVTFKETGLTLTVTPRVLADNRIEMVLEPSVLVLTGFTTTDPPAPIIDTRSAKTQVTIDGGRWLVIGGLMRYNEQVVERGVPLLKDLPLIGWLFRTKDKVREKSNLVIFVSATVLNAEKVDRETEKEVSGIQEHRREHLLEGGPFPPPQPKPAADLPKQGSK